MKPSSPHIGGEMRYYQFIHHRTRQRHMLSPKYTSKYIVFTTGLGGVDVRSALFHARSLQAYQWLEYLKLLTLLFGDQARTFHQLQDAI